MATVKATIGGVEGTVENITTASGSVLATLAAEVVTQTKSITANGTYTPDSGKDGFSSVTVNVPSGGGSAAQGSFTPTEATYTQTIETGLDEVHGIAVCLDKGTASQDVRTLCAVIIDITNDYVYRDGSNGSGSSLWSGGGSCSVELSAKNYVGVSASGGTVTITSEDVGGGGYFIPATYYWYAW